MRQLRDAYRQDARVRAALAALAQDRELTIGACHGGVISVLLAALCVERGPGGAPVIVCNDPATLVGAAALLFAVALLAGFIPARRASRVEPMQALRHE